jgi:SAM-dependent methyltransferase
MLTPRRRRGVEILDDENFDPKVMIRSMGDVERANQLFGGANAVLHEISPSLATLPKCATLLDVGTGTADIPALARPLAEKHGITFKTIGFDVSPTLLEHFRNRHNSVVVGDALQLPFSDASVDIVTCSQVLHHFRDADAQRLIVEMNRVARICVVISDLRRSVVAAGGLWLASFLLKFHPVSRHDGVVSVMRGFTPDELRELVSSAIGKSPAVNRRRGFRVTTSWKPVHAR